MSTVQDALPQSKHLSPQIFVPILGGFCAGKKTFARSHFRFALKHTELAM